MSATGAEVDHWPLSQPLGTSGRLLAGVGGVWALGEPGYDLAGTWLGPKLPGSR